MTADAPFASRLESSAEASEAGSVNVCGASVTGDVGTPVIVCVTVTVRSPSSFPEDVARGDEDAADDAKDVDGESSPSSHGSSSPEDEEVSFAEDVKPPCTPVAFITESAELSVVHTRTCTRSDQFEVPQFVCRSTYRSIVRK